MDNFRFRRVRLLNHLGAEVEYEEKGTHQKEEHWITTIKKSSYNRHPDLSNAVKGLRIHVAQIFGLLAVGMFKPIEDFTEDEKSMLDEILEGITVTGVHVSGVLDEETGRDGRGVVITATRKVLNNKTLVMNTPRIDYNNTAYDEIDNIINQVDLVAKESYEYILKRKFAQMSLFSAQEADEEAKGDEKDADATDGDLKSMEDKLEKEKREFKAEKAASRAKEAAGKTGKTKASTKSVTKSDLKAAAKKAVAASKEEAEA